MTEQHVKIEDPEAFPGKIAKVKAAAQALREFTAEFDLILTSTEPNRCGALYEASSFTATGRPAPIYGPLLEALTLWAENMKSATTAVCDSADNCAETAWDEFLAIMGVDEAAAKTIERM